MYSPSPSTGSDVAKSKKRSLWHNRDFLLLWSGQTISSMGTNISRLALPLLALALFHSPAQAGLLGAMRLFPYLFFSLPVGAFVDRWNRKAVMIRSDLVRWLALGSVPLAFALGHLTLVQLYIVAFVEGTANVLFSLAQISSLPRVVPEEHVGQAYALSQTAEATAELAGPGLSALIMSLARTTVPGAILSYLVDSITYLVSVLSLRSMKAEFQTERVKSRRISLWQEIVEGQRFLWKQKLLRLMALLTTGINFLQISINLAVIVLAQQHLHMDSASILLIFSMSGIGGVFGGFISSWVQARVRFGIITIGSVLVWTVAAFMLAIGTNALLLTLGETLILFTWAIYGVMIVTYRLSLVPDELQGRINSSFRLLTFGIEPVGAAIGGALLTLMDSHTVLWLITGGMLLCLLVACCTSLRKA